MRTFSVNGDTYVVEFRHVKPGRGISKRLRGFIQAATTVVVMQIDRLARSPVPNMVAIETVLCDTADKFSRREGRLRAISKLADRCGKIRPFKVEFLIGYTSVDPEPVRSAALKRPKLAENERKNRYEKGFDVRARRANARAARL